MKATKVAGTVTKPTNTARIHRSTSGASHKRDQEAEHHRRHRRHDLDHRLDRPLEGRRGEVAGVHRAEQRQRHREEHRVDRALERAGEQRHETQLRLEVVAAGGLPRVARLVVALVVHLAEQRLPD